MVKINKKDMIMSGKWMESTKTQEEKLQMSRYSVILSYDTSLKELSKSLNELAEKHKVKILHSDVIYKLLESYDKYLEDIDKKLTELKNEPTDSVTIIPEFIFRTPDPIVFGIKIESGLVKVNQKVYTGYGLTIFIGKIDSIQKDKANIDEVEIDQEVCIKVNTKKNIGADIKPDEELYISN